MIFCIYHVFIDSPLPSSNGHAIALAGTDISPAIRIVHDSDSDLVMDPDEQRDYADQGPPSDSDLDGDTQILATLLIQIVACINAADIDSELLLQDIPVQPPVVIGSPKHSLTPIVNPSDENIEVLLAALRWDMQQRRFGLTAEGLEKLHALAVELLDLLKENMPDRTGGVKGWKFEKAHSILHKVRDILLLGWSENFSNQGPEHSHIDN
jgi:hypothetical protein